MFLLAKGWSVALSGAPRVIADACVPAPMRLSHWGSLTNGDGLANLSDAMHLIKVADPRRVFRSGHLLSG